MAQRYTKDEKLKHGKFQADERKKKITMKLVHMGTQTQIGRGIFISWR